MSAKDTPPSPLRRWLSTLPILAVLLAVLVQWTGSQLQSKVIQAGESFWPGYGSELRREPIAPTPPTPPKESPASTEGVDQDLIGDLLGSDEAADAREGVDEDLIGDLLADEATVDEDGIDDDLIGDLLADEAPEAEDDGIDDDLIGDLLADEASEPEADEDAVDDDLIGDLLGGDDGIDTDLIGDLLGEPEADAVSPAQARYARQLEAYEREQERVTSIAERRSESVQRFARVDLALESFVGWVNTHIKHFFVLLLSLAAVTATWTRHHIALRNIHGPRGDRISAGSQLVANLLVLVSLFAQRSAWEASGILPDHPILSWFWIAAFVAMSAGNVFHLVKPMAKVPDADEDAQDTWGAALLAVPLYATMALLSAGWFFLGEGYFAGLAVYLDKLTEHAQLYLQVGLYVWAGMLLKRTSLAQRSFDVLRPWGLPPELLAIVVVVASAIPTAYSGASGIFVIAVGAILFQELRAAGARKSLAMASAAMSGSLGVVLRPCLLVVIVAYLNPVSSDALFGWGRWVFLLTAGLFALVAFLTRQGPWTLKKAPDASAQSVAALKGLGLFIGLFVVVLLGYWGTLDVGLDQHSAPMILPVILVGMLVLDRVMAKRQAAPPPRLPVVRLQTEAATSEAAVHIGALLLLMGMSVCLGGLVERAELMSAVPASFDSPWAAMALLVALLVVVGMTMDPYGAVILVSATLADVAIASGIDPVHFWMVVLVAFELGYLTPPVALNHLLVRQVVSEIEDPGPEDPPPTNFWQKHERILLPVTVMAIALVLVAFVPLALTG